MTTTAIRQFQIGEGGLLRRFESAAHLTKLRSQIVSAIAVTWLPVMVFGLSNMLINGEEEPLLHDAGMHVRLLVAAPVFLILDQIFPRVCRNILGQLVAQSFISKSAEPRFDKMLRGATRMADSTLPELLLVLFAIGLAVAGALGVVPASRRGPWTAAQLWYSLTDVPFFQFLLWRSLWRWFIWVRILIGLAWIGLDLVPTHPDRRGGINFLRLPSMGYCVGLLFAMSSVQCAEWGRRFIPGSTLASFKPLLFVFASLASLVALGPLLLFAPQLTRARRRGLVEHDAVAAAAGRRFRLHIQEPGAELSAQETAPLVEQAEIYRETVSRMSWLLFDRKDVIILLLATLAPVLPVIILRVPSEEWRALLGLVTGGWLR